MAQSRDLPGRPLPAKRKNQILISNYGWPLREGFDREHPEKTLTSKPEQGLRGEPFVEPIAVYKNIGAWKGDAEAMGNNVSGGYVYRGKALPELDGSYVFGDWSGTQGTPQGRLFVDQPSAEGAPWTIGILRVGRPYGCVVAFGEDPDGELYVLSNASTGLTAGGGKIWKLVPAAKQN